MRRHCRGVFHSKGGEATVSAMPGDVRPPSLDVLPPLLQRGRTSHSPFPRLHIRDVAVFGALMSVFALALKPVVDNDLFWHLATGRYIWATGHIPLSDPFSWTVPGCRWIAHEWLTELWLYPLYTHGGYGALMLAFAAIITAALALNYGTERSLGATRPWAVAITVIAAVARARPEGRPAAIHGPVPAMTLQGQVVIALRRLRALPGVWLLIPLMALWANMHGGFIFGLALI